MSSLRINTVLVSHQDDGTEHWQMVPNCEEQLMLGRTGLLGRDWPGWRKDIVNANAMRAALQEGTWES